MRDQAEVSSGVAAATHDVEAGALFIITLSSSTAPVALEAPAIPELTGLAIFRSKRVEDGRDRFRLHLGYFDSVAAAEAVLPVVRRHYPAAWVGPAPTSGMGSLDDTSVAQFKFIRAPRTLVRDTRAPTPLPPAPTAAAKAAPVAAKRVPMKSTPGPTGPRSPAPAQPPAQGKARPVPATGPTASPAQRGGVAARAAKVGAPPQPALPPRQVLNLLETGTPRGGAPARPVMQPLERAAVVGSLQRFAVQIVWSMDPVDLTQVPKLAIFDAYTLYKVQVDRAGRRWYGLRLGFFSDPVSARQVALYSRSDFSAAAVVPVSDRECERAEQAAITAFPRAEVHKTEDRIPLFDEPAAPAPAPVRKPASGRASPVKAGSRASPSSQALAKKARPKTTQELADELIALQEAPDFSGSDPLNDSGVRHLAVNVVRKSRLSSLFGLGTRDKDES